MVEPGEEDPLIGTLLGDRYRVERPLDSGGMGAVYEARDETLSRRVVVKVMHPHLALDRALLERFRREALAAAALNHPHIVQTTDFAMVEGQPAFMVMEYLKGVTLASVLRDEGQLDLNRAASIGGQVLDALAMAHRSGIVHRDLKPSNIFLTQLSGVSDVVKLLDFGIAKLWDSPELQRLTRTGQLVGTPLFMAPEQLRGEEVDGRVDLYAVGVNLYGALTGRPPYLAQGGDLVQAMLTTEPTPIVSLRPDVDPRLAAVVHRAIAKDKNDRFSSAEEMRSALEPWLGSSVRALHATPSVPMPARPSVPSSTDAAPSRSGSPRNKKSGAKLWLILAGGALALGAVAALGMVLLLSWWNPTEPEAMAATPTTPLTVENAPPRPARAKTAAPATPAAPTHDIERCAFRVARVPSRHNALRTALEDESATLAACAMTLRDRPHELALELELDGRGGLSSFAVSGAPASQGGLAATACLRTKLHALELPTPREGQPTSVRVDIELNGCAL
jgi:serine/threonine-protein kinase